MKIHVWLILPVSSWNSTRKKVVVNVLLAVLELTVCLKYLIASVKVKESMVTLRSWND